jgi:hypothetical protein
MPSRILQPNQQQIPLNLSYLFTRHVCGTLHSRYRSLLCACTSILLYQYIQRGFGPSLPVKVLRAIGTAKTARHITHVSVEAPQKFLRSFVLGRFTNLKDQVHIYRLLCACSWSVIPSLPPGCATLARRSFSVEPLRLCGVTRIFSCHLCTLIRKFVFRSEGHQSAFSSCSLCLLDVIRLKLPFMASSPMQRQNGPPASPPVGSHVAHKASNTGCRKLRLQNPQQHDVACTSNQGTSAADAGGKILAPRVPLVRKPSPKRSSPTSKRGCWSSCVTRGYIGRNLSRRAEQVAVTWWVMRAMHELVGQMFLDTNLVLLGLLPGKKATG